MTEELTPALTVALVVQISLLLAGAALLWRLVLRPVARANRLNRLPPWPIGGFDFGLAVCIAIALGVVGQALLLGGTTRLLPDRNADFDLVLGGASFQFGLLLGVMAAAAYVRGRIGATPSPPPAAAPPAPSRVLSGMATFAVAIPVLMAINLPWTYLLDRFGISTDKQELVDLFARADSPALVVLLTVLAVVLAPVAEELIFRAGLFRFLRDRTPRWVALGVPAVVFGFLHGNVAAFAPLVALGVIFSLAYERTGRIATSMIAHGLFNLNTIVLLLVGVPV